MATITADLKDGFAVELRNGTHVWYADEPDSVGGTDTGPTPYDLLLSSVAACTSITVSMFCQRKGWTLHSVSARYEHDRVHVDDCEDCEDETKGYIDRVRSHIFVEGDFDEEQRTRLAEVVRRCPVHKTLDHSVEFTTETVFVG